MIAVQRDTRVYRFYSNCVCWPRHDVFCAGGLRDLINQRREISRRAFLCHVEREELRGIEENLGYTQHPRQGLTMAGDYHIEYFVSRWHDNRVYGFRHSGIEYVFVSE
jgi:hypothetical protein